MSEADTRHNVNNNRININNNLQDAVLKSLSSFPEVKISASLKIASVLHLGSVMLLFSKVGFRYNPQ